MQFKSEINQSKIEEKIKSKYNQAFYKKYLKPDEIDKKLYTDIVTSFPTYFF